VPTRRLINTQADKLGRWWRMVFRRKFRSYNI